MTARSVGPAIDEGPQPGRSDDVRSLGQIRHQSDRLLTTQGGHHKAKWTVLPAGTRDLLYC